MDTGADEKDGSGVGRPQARPPLASRHEFTEGGASAAPSSGPRDCSPYSLGASTDAFMNPVPVIDMWDRMGTSWPS